MFECFHFFSFIILFWFESDLELIAIANKLGSYTVKSSIDDAAVNWNILTPIKQMKLHPKILNSLLNNFRK